jgi:alcohol dehydrogenase (NADP+)
MKLGAKDFILTNKEGWADDWKFTFDFILNCADATDQFNLPDYFGTLKVHGKFHMVGFPDKDLPSINAQAFAPNGCYMGASHLGSRPEMEEMLELASSKKINGWIETIPISEEGCKKAVERVANNDNVRYRLTLNNFDAIFGKR